MAQAIRLSPDYFPALFNLGYFYFKQDKMSDAEPLLRRAADAAGDNFNAYYLLGAACRSLGRSEDALRAWRSALRIQPDNLRLMQVMSVEYSKGRYFGDAAELAKKRSIRKMTTRISISLRSRPIRTRETMRQRVKLPSEQSRSFRIRRAPTSNMRFIYRKTANSPAG